MNKIRLSEMAMQVKECIEENVKGYQSIVVTNDHENMFCVCKLNEECDMMITYNITTDKAYCFISNYELQKTSDDYIFAHFNIIGKIKEYIKEILQYWM